MPPGTAPRGTGGLFPFIASRSAYRERRAIGTAVFAHRDQLRQAVRKGVQPLDLVFDLAALAPGRVEDVAAGGEQFGDLGQGEAEGLRPADKPQPFDISR